MDIYLQSCGQKGTQDYRWLKIYKDNEWLEKVERQEPKIVEISEFYTPSTPAVVMYRKEQQLILFIYWLKTKQRSLDYGRPVQNSLVFIGGEENDCLLFQMLASKALEDWQLFADNFDNCVQWGNNEYGFQVEKSSFEKFIFKKDVVKDYEQLKTPNKTRKLACDVLNVKSKSPEKQKIIQETKQQWIKALAEELKTTKLPDNWKGQLVVVAENVAEEVLQHDVWRGISDRVAHNNESGVWKEIQETPVEEITKKYPKLNLILTVILISFLVILVVFSLSQSPKNPTPQPKSEPTIVEPSPTPTTSSEPEIQPSPTPTTSAEPEIKPNSHPESQSSTETPTQSDSSNQEIPKTSSIQEEQLDRENNSPT